MAHPPEMAATSLRTSGAELKAILEKTGRRLKALSGIDKLDLLNDITEQIKEQIETRGKMNLRFSELNDLLTREGLAPQLSAKDAIQQLLQLRCAQLERLGSYSRTGLEEKDNTFRQALMNIPHSEINSCFAADDALSSAYAANVESTQWEISPREEPLRSSGQELKLVLEKTGRRLQCFNGMDKLDLLNFIAEQIKEKVETRGRMNLRFSELNDLLVREGLTPQPSPADAIRELLALRQRQLKRLGNYSRTGVEEQDKTFCLALVVIPPAEVRNCFAADDVFRTEVQAESVIGARSPRGSGVSSPPDAHLVPPARLRSASSLPEKNGSASSLPTEKNPCETTLKSDSRALRTILEQTGHSLQGFGCMDKVDLLKSIAEQIRDKVELGQRMNLRLSDLQDFLAKEGVGNYETAKMTVEQLMILRRRELRRSSRVDAAEISNDGFTRKLKQMSDEIVEACFATDSQIANDRVGEQGSAVASTFQRFEQVQVGIPISQRRSADMPSYDMMSHVSKATPASASHGSNSGDALAIEKSAPQPVPRPELLAESGAVTRESNGSCPIIRAETRAQKAEARCEALEANVSELRSYINEAEARASLAEERAKVAELQAALQKAEARAIDAETRAEMLEAKLIAFGGDPSLDGPDTKAPVASTSVRKLSPRARSPNASNGVTAVSRSPVPTVAKNLERSVAARSQPTLVQPVAKAKTAHRTQEASTHSHMVGRPLFK